MSYLKFILKAFPILERKMRLCVEGVTSIFGQFRGNFLRKFRKEKGRKLHEGRKSKNQELFRPIL